MIFTLTYSPPQNATPSKGSARPSFFTMEGGPLLRDFSPKAWKHFLLFQKDFAPFYSTWAQEAIDSPGTKIIRNL